MDAVTILDGGMGKMLRRMGAPFRQPEWSSLALMEAPEAVVRAHAAFIAAGAEVIITNNYAVVPYHHDEGFFERRGAELTANAAILARRAAESSGRPVQVAGSMPPLFGSYEPDRVDAARAAPIYATIAAALEPHVDLWVGETLSTIVELDLIAAAVDDVGSELPLWMAFSLPEQWDPDVGIALRSGESITQLVQAVDRLGDRVAAVLFNCSLPERTGPALRRLRDELDASGRPDIRTGGYANAFPTERRGDYEANEVIYERREELTADAYADIVAGWINDGATIVGGCCDMYPDHIAALAERFG